MKYVASLFSGSHGFMPRAFLSVLTVVSLSFGLSLMTGCSDDEASTTFPTQIPQVAKHWLFGVGGTDASNVYACGRNGAMFHFDGSTWSPMEMGVTTDIVDIQNLNGTLYAVGHNGKIWVNTGSSWSSQDSGTSNDLFGVGLFQDEIYVGGYNGTIRKLSGSSWNGVGGTMVLRDPQGASIDTLRVDRDLVSIVTIGDNYFGGSFLDPLWNQPIFGIDGTKGMILAVDVPFEGEETIFDYWLRPLSGDELVTAEWVVSGSSDPDTVSRNFLGSSEGYLFQLQDTGNWAKDNLKVTRDRGQGISDMYLTLDNKLYMVTDDGMVVLREEDGTTTVLYDQAESLTGIWGTDSSNMYIVGFMEDELYHAVHTAGTDTLAITKIPVTFPGTSSKSAERSAGDGIIRDEYNRPVYK